MIASNLKPFILIFFPSFETFYAMRYALCALPSSKRLLELM
jgi:hypothetical protein